MKPRISILGIMAATALTATALMALRGTQEVWASAHFSLTLALLCLAIPSIAYRRAGRRAFWVGFVAFGWPYLLFCFGPIPGISIKPPPLITTKLLEMAYPHFSTVPSKEVTVFGEGYWEDSRNIRITMGGSIGKVTFFRNDTEDFLRTGHAIVNLIFACVGGLVAQSFAAGRSLDAPPSTESK